MVTKVKSGVIGDNTVGITQLNVSDGSDGQALVTNGSGTLSFATVATAGISSSADATAITIGSDESVDFAKGIVVEGSGTLAGVYLNGTNSDTATQGNFVRYGTNFAVQSNAANSVLMTKAYNGSVFVDSLSVKSDGKVGIGTTSPTVPLDVYNGSGWGGIDLDGTSGGEIRFQKAGTNYGNIYANDSSGFIINAQNGLADIFFQSGGTTKMAMLDSGRVVVGGGTGSSGDFVVTNNGAEGLEFFAGNSSDVNAIQHYNRSNSNYCENRQIANNHTFYIGATEKVEIDGSGRLLVGATSAGSQSGPFFVQGSSTYACTGQFENTNSGGHYIMFSTSGTSRALIGVGSNSGSGSLANLAIKCHGGDIQFFANNVKHLTLYSNGVLAAGTSTSDLGHNIVNYTTSGYLGLTGDLTGYSAGSYPTLKTNGSYIYFDIGGSYSAYMQSNGTLNANSDRRLKENITTLSSGQLAKVCALRGVNYTWIDERQTGTQVGVIAQEIQEEYPELVGNGGITDGTLTVNYAGLVSPLIEAIKELKTELDAAKARITTLEG